MIEQSFIKTEEGLIIELGGGICHSGAIDCKSACRDVYDSGNFTIINSCTLPITITGFELSDPDRFSLFSYPEHTGIGTYFSGNVNDIPFTLKPREKKKINTFFHPYYEELETGNAGTILNRTGDKFGSNVQIYPGFPILNCPEKSDCDSSVILSGEFLCDGSLPDMEWAKNKENIKDDFDPSDLESSPLPEPTNEFFLLKKPTFEYTNSVTSSSAQNYFTGLMEAMEQYAYHLESVNWLETYSDFGITGTLDAVSKIVKNLQENSKDDSRVNLYNEDSEFLVEPSDFIKYKTSFTAGDIQTVNYQGDSYLAMTIDSMAIQGIQLMTDQALFINEDGNGSMDIFLCSAGDFSVDQIKE